MKDRGTLTFFPELEVSASPLKPKGSTQSASLSSIPSRPQCCESTGPTCGITETSPNGESGQTLLAMSLPEASRASRFPLQDEEEARRTIATSGRQCLMSSKDSGRLLSSVKMLLESKAWSSPSASMTWSAQAIGQSRLIYRLVLLDYLPWNGTSGLLPRPMAMSWKGTPRRSYRGQPSLQSGTRIVQAMRSCYNDPPYPHPSFLEAVKGFPISWTELSQSETQSLRKSRKSSQKQSTDN